MIFKFKVLFFFKFIDLLLDLSNICTEWNIEMRKQVKCETFKVPRRVFMSHRTWCYCPQPLTLRHAAVNSSGLGAMWHAAIWLGVWLWKVAIIMFGLYGADLSPTLITWFPVRYLGWVTKSWKKAAWRFLRAFGSVGNKGGGGAGEPNSPDWSMGPFENHKEKQSQCGSNFSQKRD